MRTKCSIFSLSLALSATCLWAQLAQRDPRYRLQPSDVIDVQYRYTPEYNQTASVQPDGFVSLQLVGDLKLAGLTLDEARGAIREKAASRLRDPEVFVLLKDYVKPQITVGGEVANPGRFELRGTTSALQAIEMAGGFKNLSAKHSQVILFRRISADTGETTILDLKRIMKGKNLSEDPTLQPGDMLLVPQNRVSQLERYIKWANVSLLW
jgi:polysaccharide export outer membrane protein